MTTGDMQSPEPDLRDQFARWTAFLRRTLRFWPAVAIALAVGALASAGFLFFKKPTYKSETVILYSEGIKQGEGDEARDASRSVTMRLKEILTSRAELARVVEQFHLYPDVVREHGPMAAVDELRKHVEFKAPGGDSFGIAFEGTSPEQAKRVTEQLAQLVIDQDSSLRKKLATTTRDFLELEKMGTEARLKDAEQSLAAFMAAHPRFALDATPLTTGAAIRATLSPAPGTTAVTPGAPFAPAQRGAAPAPRRVAVDPTATAALHDATEEQGRATAAFEAAQSRLTDLQSRFTPQYPDVRNAQAEADRAKARLAAAGAELARLQTQSARPASAAQASVTAAAEAVAEGAPAPSGPPVITPVGDAQKAAPTRVAARATQAAAVPPRTGAREHDLVALETEWVRLTRGVTEARQHQEHVESALFKADLTANSEDAGHGVSVSVIDPAYLPEKPVPPGRSIVVGLILAVSLVIGLIAAAAGAALDDRIFDYNDLAPIAPALVEVPRRLVGRAHG